MRHLIGSDRPLPLPMAFVAALALHAALLLLANAGPLGFLLVPRSSLLFEVPNPTHPMLEFEELSLGIDSGTAATDTFIGYDEPQEQLARASEVEQAEFEDDPAAGAGGAATEASSTEGRGGEMAANEASPASANGTAGEAVAEAPIESTPLLAPAPPPLPAALQSPALIRAVTDAQLDAWMDEARVAASSAVEASIEPQPEAASPPSVDARAVEPVAAGPAEHSAVEDAPPQPTPVIEPGSASPEGPAANREAGSGEQSDRESDATSLIDVPPDQWKRGKPLAAKGLEIRTRRPYFPELTKLTAAPRNPIIEIYFDRTGVPRRANVMRSSGDERVDGPVIDSLYRWRASGAALAKLGEGETIRLSMKILLVAE